MKISVLLDTSFLISLVDRNRVNHNTAVLYYKLLLEQQTPIYFSSIVAAEIAIKQPITDLPLKTSELFHSISRIQTSLLAYGICLVNEMTETAVP